MNDNYLETYGKYVMKFIRDIDRSPYKGIFKFEKFIKSIHEKLIMTEDEFITAITILRFIYPEYDLKCDRDQAMMDEEIYWTPWGDQY